jgi:hypothetical protein
MRGLKTLLAAATVVTAGSPAFAKLGDETLSLGNPDNGGKHSAAVTACLNKNAVSFMMATFFTQTQQSDTYLERNVAPTARGKGGVVYVSMRSQELASEAKRSFVDACRRNPKLDLVEAGAGNDFRYGYGEAPDAEMHRNMGRKPSRGLEQ